MIHIVKQGLKALFLVFLWGNWRVFCLKYPLSSGFYHGGGDDKKCVVHAWVTIFLERKDFTCQKNEL